MDSCSGWARTQHSPPPPLPLGRSGKSSIQKVVFHKMTPNETLFLESTNKIVKDGEWVHLTLDSGLRRTSHYTVQCMWMYMPPHPRPSPPPASQISATVPLCSFRCAGNCAVRGRRVTPPPPSPQIWDVPGQIEMQVFDPENMFGGCGALIFIIDAQVGCPAC